VLTKNAKLTEAGNTFTSDRIVFYTDKEIVSVNYSLVLFPIDLVRRVGVQKPP